MNYASTNDLISLINCGIELHVHTNTFLCFVCTEGPNDESDNRFETKYITSSE